MLNKEFSNVFFSIIYWLKKIENSGIPKIVDNFEDNTAAGFDKETIKILKHNVEFIFNPLDYVYNSSIQQSIFFYYFKFAVVKPILKGGDRKNINNYRPISLPTFFSKL